jgi:DNA-binding CsgD family transcriptional regulator
MHLARVHFNGLDWSSSVRLLEEALVQAGDDLALPAEIELHLAINLDLLRSSVPDTLEHARSAVRLTDSIGADAMHAEALALEAKNEMLLGAGWPDRTVERARVLEHATETLPADRWLRDYLASMRGWTDDLDGAISTLEEVEAAASARGDEVSLNWALARAAELRCYAGEFRKARVDIERGSEIARQAGQTANEAIYLGLTALVDAHLGSPQTARSAGERALDLAPRVGAAMARRTALAGLGLLELSLGRPADAHGHLVHLTEETLAAGVREPGAMRFLPDAIEALVELGRPEEAEALLEDFAERAAALGRVTAGAAALRCRGLILAAGDDLEAAELVLAGAVHGDEGVTPFERARTRLALGALQRRQRKRTAARKTLQLALGSFEEVAAELWAEKARAELRRIGGRAASPDGLTPTETRIAELVAQGKSNKEVAADLVITVNTVESTLRSVYRKLDVHSRTEMARKLTGND